jgi:hypothetical protein
LGERKSLNPQISTDWVDWLILQSKTAPGC